VQYAGVWQQIVGFHTGDSASQWLLIAAFAQRRKSIFLAGGGPYDYCSRAHEW
jgi:hypothetical protein